MVIIPEWPAPAQVTALMTTRDGGFSEGSFHALNTAAHVGDDPDLVQRNRQHLRDLLNVPSEPVWLNQVHGTAVVLAESVGEPVDADGSYTSAPGVVCVVQTADCLPVLFTNRAGTRVAAAHAGWAGLLAGVLESTVAKFAADDELLAWLGAGIAQCHFEVGAEVREAFINAATTAVRDTTAKAFIPSQQSGHWMGDLYQLARIRLEPLAVKVYGGGLCTVCDSQRFFSYRRDGATGRMASLIYLKRD